MTDSQFALVVVGTILFLNVAIVVVPLGYSLWLSFHEHNVILRRMAFIGLENYQTLLANREVLDAVFRSITLTVIVVAVSLVLGLAMGLVLNEDFRGRGVLRTLVLAPWAISEVVTATMWILVLDPNIGSLSDMLTAFGLTDPDTVWLTSRWAIFWLAVAFAWHIAPLGAFFLLAVLQTIPRDLYRAATLDGAGMLERFRHVTLPHLRASVLVVLVVITVEAFRMFDLMFALTRGGPGTATQILPLLIFRYNFEFSQYGLASAASYILIVLAVLLAAVYFLVLRRRRRVVRRTMIAGEARI